MRGSGNSGSPAARAFAGMVTVPRTITLALNVAVISVVRKTMSLICVDDVLVTPFRTETMFPKSNIIYIMRYSAHHNGDSLWVLR